MIASEPDVNLVYAITIYFLNIFNLEVESHLQSTTTLHLDLTCATLKKTTERLEQTAIQVQELKAANSTLSSKVYAQDVEISKLRREYTTFVWKVDGFNKVLEDAKIGISECVQSVPFYAGKQGYKLRVRIYPDGGQSNRNRYLSVFLVFLVFLGHFIRRSHLR